MGNCLGFHVNLEQFAKLVGCGSLAWRKRSDQPSGMETMCVPSQSKINSPVSFSNQMASYKVRSGLFPEQLSLLTASHGIEKSEKDTQSAQKSKNLNSLQKSCQGERLAGAGLAGVNRC